MKAIYWVCFSKKNNTLAGDFGFVGNKIAFTKVKLTKMESYFIIYKSNENTSYLNTKLIKTVNVSVLKSNYKRKVFSEIENVVTDSGEGRCFL